MTMETAVLDVNPITKIKYTWSPLSIAADNLSNRFTRRATADTYHPSFITYSFKSFCRLHDTVDETVIDQLTEMLMAGLNKAADLTELKLIVWRTWPRSTFADGWHEIYCRVSME